MTRAFGAAVGAALGAACGTALWEVFTLHSAGAAVTVIGPCGLLYALVGAVLAGSATSSGAAAPTAASSTSAACQAVLPGVPLTAVTPSVVVPQPRAVGATP